MCVMLMAGKTAPTRQPARRCCLNIIPAENKNYGIAHIREPDCIKPEGRLKTVKTGFQTAFRLLRPAGFVFQTDTLSEQGLDFGLMADADDEGVG